MINFLILLVIVLAIAVVARLIRVFELSAELKGEEPWRVNANDNRTQSLLVFLGGLGFLVYVAYYTLSMDGKLLPAPASEHGVKTDGLLNITWMIIGPMFFLTHILLAYFAFKYYFRKDRTATFFAHSTKLEMIWTVIPTVTLTSLIIYGISTWNEITSPAPESAIEIELYAKQFDWTARYAGSDNTLGRSGFRLIEGSNTLGVDMQDPAAADDKVVRGEFHIPVGRPVNFKFHSRDVIHSAYMPHFRAQMNCVPGMTTQFHFVPTKTTEEMRAETGNAKFDYILLCNKICGGAHYNMQMTIVVETEEAYNKWLNEKKTLTEDLAPKPVETVVDVQTDTLSAPMDSTVVTAASAAAQHS